MNPADVASALPACSCGKARELTSDGRCLNCGVEHESRSQARLAQLRPIHVFQVEDAEDFAAVDEPGADPLVTIEDECAFPVGGLWIDYGDGGAGKTTLVIDQSVHWSAGVSWHDLLTPARSLRILMIEAEGPRPEFRRKLRRRLESWDGPPLEGRLQILAEPWGTVTLREEGHRAELARLIVAGGYDVVVIGPLRKIGMRGGGTLDEIEEFIALVEDVSRLAERPIAFRIIHHENRAGQISGAWEGVPDVLVHVQPQGHGNLRVFWQKVKWASELHQQSTNLCWADGEAFTIVEREVVSEATISDAILEAVRANPGISWTRLRDLNDGTGHKRVRGRGTAAKDVRDQLLMDGVLVNDAPVQGQFRLWVADDPAAPRSAVGTASERLTFPSPAEDERPTRSPFPPIRGTGTRERPDETGLFVEESMLEEDVA